MEIVHAALYTMIYLALLTSGGNRVCQWLLSLTGLRAANAQNIDPNLKAGRIIGSLERAVMAIGAIVQSWEVLAAVVVLKSIARFKELDEKLPAEYFLVGSLFSILWAVVITQAWLLYDQHMGLHLSQSLTLAEAQNHANAR